MAELGGQGGERLPAYPGDHRVERDPQIRHPQLLAVGAREQRIRKLVEAQRKDPGESVFAAHLLGSEDGAVGHRLRPCHVLLDRHGQRAGHHRTDHRSDG